MNDFCDIFNLSQLVNGPTCFKKGCIPSLVDVIMTNKKSLCFKSQNVPTGVSDCHNIISTVIKGEVFHEPKKLRYYRSYKTFDIENFNDDIAQIKIDQTCHEVDSVYNSDFVPPEQRFKKYVFIDFLFNLVTEFLCFLNFSQFLLL
jgi:hypothetical protein